MENSKIGIRARFCKIGRAKFISHLDLLRCFERGLKKSKISVWYTQGYSKRIYMMFPLALSLGTSSECEIIDFCVTEEMSLNEIKDKLNTSLPDGIRIEEVYFPLMEHTEIGFAEYIINVEHEDNESFYENFRKFIYQDKIIAEKFSKKRGILEIDIKEDIKEFEIKNNEKDTEIRIILSAGSERNINVNTVFDGYKKFIGQEINRYKIKRTLIFNKEMKEFR